MMMKKMEKIGRNFIKMDVWIESCLVLDYFSIFMDFSKFYLTFRAFLAKKSHS